MNRIPTTASDRSAGPNWRRQGVLALLLRLLGIAFLGCALASGANAFFWYCDPLSPDAVIDAWIRLIYRFFGPALQGLLGIYFIAGGHWAFALANRQFRSRRAEQPQSF
jgi:hypothetical protein